MTPFKPESYSTVSPYLIAAGAQRVKAGGVKDPAGNTWWIATQVSP
jgi:hypothetical protein